MRRRAWLPLTLLACITPAGSPLAAGLCPGEADRAKATRQRIEQEWPLRGSGDESTRYVQSLGVRLAQANPGAGGIPWRFALVRNLAANAFSIGGGFVYVTEGAVTFSRSEAELAAILAHELGHELAGHFCRQPTTGSSGLFDLFGDTEDPSPSQEIRTGSVRQTVDPRKEEQADRIAVAILQAAGYDPNALLRVARRLPAGGESHLPDPLRVQNLQRLLTGLPERGNPPDSSAFQAVKSQLQGEAGRR